MTIFLGTRIPYQNMNCHPDRSAAKWRACPERSRMGTCCSLNQHPIYREVRALSFVIPRACDFFGMTIFLGHSNPLPKHELSSRPERSEVEGPAVDSPSIKCKWK